MNSEFDEMEPLMRKDGDVWVPTEEELALTFLCTEQEKKGGSALLDMALVGYGELGEVA